MIESVWRYKNLIIIIIIIIIKHVDKIRALSTVNELFVALHCCSVATDANISDAPVPPGGDTVRKINMATAGVSQLVFEYFNTGNFDRTIPCQLFESTQYTHRTVLGYKAF